MRQEEAPLAVRLVAFGVFLLICALSSIGLVTVLEYVEARCS